MSDLVLRETCRHIACASYLLVCSDLKTNHWVGIVWVYTVLSTKGNSIGKLGDSPCNPPGSYQTWLLRWLKMLCQAVTLFVGMKLWKHFHVISRFWGWWMTKLSAWSKTSKMIRYSFGNSTWQWIFTMFNGICHRNWTTDICSIPTLRFCRRKTFLLSEATTSLGSDIVVTYTIKGSFLLREIEGTSAKISGFHPGWLTNIRV